MVPTSARQADGNRAEDLACQHLQQTGLKLLDRNYRGRFGEIDLIMQEGSVIAFVEVRYRSNNRKLDASETIDARKCGRIIKTALQYMQSMNKPDSWQYRFDVVTVTGTLEKPDIDWIRDAFQA